LVLVGKNKAQLREASPQTITDEQIETFFSVLADTCNVVRSAKAAGFTANWACRKRKLDAAFRAGWARAIAEGYAKLELVLLDRAMNGTVKRVPSGGSEKRIREYPNQLDRPGDQCFSAGTDRSDDSATLHAGSSLGWRSDRLRQQEWGKSLPVAGTASAGEGNSEG
jgi:hypothetical protein